MSNHHHLKTLVHQGIPTNPYEAAAINNGFVPADYPHTFWYHGADYVSAQAAMEAGSTATFKTAADACQAHGIPIVEALDTFDDKLNNEPITITIPSGYAAKVLLEHLQNGIYDTSLKIRANILTTVSQLIENKIANHHSSTNVGIWDGKPADWTQAGWHLLRRKAKGFIEDNKEVPWHYTPGLSFKYNGPQITPWTNPDRGCAEERHIAWDWDYIGPMTVG